MTEIFSMTGYARSQGQVGESVMTVEAKSVNHRYLDLKLHLPGGMRAFENETANLCREYFQRGRIEIWVNQDPGDTPVEVKWSRPLAKGMARAMTEMKLELGLAGEPDLALLASHKDVLVVDDTGGFGEQVWPDFKKLVSACFENLKQMRAREGQALAEDIIARVGEIEKNLEVIGDKAGSVVVAYADKLKKRVQDLTGDTAINGDRLAQEVAILADRSDITEELVRARSHLEQFRKVLGEDGPKGRKLDFLVQELFREINTSSNKAQDSEISAIAVDIKAEMEKVREQIQNIE